MPPSVTPRVEVDHDGDPTGVVPRDRPKRNCANVSPLGRPHPIGTMVYYYDPLAPGGQFGLHVKAMEAIIQDNARASLRDLSPVAEPGGHSPGRRRPPHV